MYFDRKLRNFIYEQCGINKICVLSENLLFRYGNQLPNVDTFTEFKNITASIKIQCIHLHSYKLLLKFTQSHT